MKRRLAKTLFRMAGWLMKIKTPHRFYKVVSFDPWKTEYSGRRWSPCELSMKTLKTSARLDWDHWDHWALQHTDCDPIPCTVCGGCVCSGDLTEEIMQAEWEQ